MPQARTEEGQSVMPRRLPRKFRTIFPLVAFAALACCQWAAAQQQPVPAPTSGFRLAFGLKDAEPQKFDGSVSVAPGEVVGVEGWRFEKGDKATSSSAWQCSTRFAGQRKLRPDEIARGRKAPPPRLIPNGIIVYLAAPERARVNVQTAGGDVSFTIADVAYGQPITQLDGNARVERVPVSVKVTGEPTHDDYGSAVLAKNGDIYVAYTSYEKEADRPVLRRRHNGRWDEPIRLRKRRGDVFETAIAEAGDGRIWVAWSEQVKGNWDIYACSVKGNRPGRAQRLSTDPGPDIYLDMAADSDGRLSLVWQGARAGQFDIIMRSLDGGKWSDEIRVSTHPANDWEPTVVADGSGKVYVAWDSYRNGNYDICLKTYTDGRPGAARMIAESPAYEAHVSLAVDPQDRLWLAWDEAGVLWGKDQGFWVKARGMSRLYSPRTLRIACLVNGDLRQPKPDLVEAIQVPNKKNNLFPALRFDARGRLWVLYRRRSMKQQGAGGGSARAMWDDYAAYYDGKQWVTDIWLPHSVGRMDVRISAVPDGGDGLLLAWASDERPWANPIPGNNNVYTTSIAVPGGPADPPALVAFNEPELEVPPNLEPNEAANVAYRCETRTTVGGLTYRLLGGETHRHTDISYDGGGDSNQYDMYRYLIDAVSQDFMAALDHDNGGGQEYSWWRTQKACDLFCIDDVFETLYGYERSVGYPNGHRNVTFARRGVRTFPRVRENGKLSADDTKKLYEYLEKNDGICFSHTSGTNMGTDWRDNDPEYEPVVEIYQGCRTSYEYEGGPRAATADKPETQVGGYRPLGFVWEALRKGYRLGFMASSDHGSTHISYCSVWATEFSRQGIFDALKARHCYGATSNIVLEYGMGEHIMGDIFEADDVQPMKVRIHGTAPIERIEVCRNEKFIYSIEPNKQDAEFTYVDTDPIRGRESYYYIRMVQSDGQIAWSSPIWVTLRG